MKQLQITQIANGFLAGSPPEPNPLDPQSTTEGKVVHLADVEKLAEYVKNTFASKDNIVDMREPSKRN